ncbi:hypothetical protein BDQ94DRAFT_146130 [Aspergillus welwitschiae]|uniref:Uncharacterized protein n=1 Tax=Aspergillus welwitschiae TaxID=1341132 RepID=A0A3F3PZ18_9EURO|nr:hypothetical protein BDQ94DRAFT_146130 [Aspergillus welwitschiae]RDH31972.1 hypothetical protein BDQ94DRAFT_146130 [Aspergillus welwitschiae]
MKHRLLHLEQGLGRSLAWVNLATIPGSETTGYPSQGSPVYKRHEDGRTAIGAMLKGGPFPVRRILNHLANQTFTSPSETGGRRMSLCL